MEMDFMVHGRLEIMEMDFMVHGRLEIMEMDFGLVSSCLAQSGPPEIGTLTAPLADPLTHNQKEAVRSARAS